MNKSLEEGELSDDSDCYTPLQRPENYSSFSSSIIKPQAPCNDSESDYKKTSSDSNSDSDEGIKQKRPKLKPRPRLLAATKPVNHKYNIWNNRIQEEVLVDTLNTCDVTKKNRSRDVESYDFPVRENFNENFNGRRDLREILTRKNKEKGDVKANERVNNKRNRKDRKNKNLRLIGKQEEEDDEDGRGAPRILMDLIINEGNTCEEIARELANKLSETKEDLLLKIVNVLGVEKSVKIFMEVKRIEAEGGMLIMNQSRRRTPGGVYLFLVKHDDNLTREQRDTIFEEERQKSKQLINMQKKKKYKEMKMKSGIKVPELLTADKLCIEKMTKEWNNERDETEHEEVENPPPTPETDYNDTTDDQKVINEISGRQPQEYDEEFLDLGGANDMDFF
nr:phosphorylated adapter RNA export protein [Onthophagus taurus]